MYYSGGGIGTTYNFRIDNIKDIYESFVAGNMANAQAAQNRADRIVSVLLSYITIPVTKVVLEHIGFDVGNATFPMKRYTTEEKEKIIADFKAAGLDI